MAEAEPLPEARNLVKHYGQVLALDGANFTAYPGEIVALTGTTARARARWPTVNGDPPALRRRGITAIFRGHDEGDERDSRPGALTRQPDDVKAPVDLRD